MSSRLRRISHVVLPPLISFVAITLAAEVIIRGLHVPAYLLPPPSKVASTAAEQAPALARATLETTIASGVGFVLSAVLGVAIAVTLSVSRWVQRAFYPYAVFFQTVPIVAIAPLLVIWFSYGLKPVIASAFIVSVFPVIANTLAGLLSVDPALADLFRLYGAKPQAALFKLRLPSALPNIMTGLRIAAGLAVIGAIVGEFVGGGGLGTQVKLAIPVQRPDIIFAAVLCASGLGLALFGSVNLLSWVLLRRWHASERG